MDRLNDINLQQQQHRPRQKVNTHGKGLLVWYNITSKQDFQQQYIHPIALEPLIGIRYIPISEVKKHNTRTDCWTILRGKVYDITPYLEFHPGGIDKLMLGAGRDCTQLFDKYHSWVNYEHLLQKCYLGHVDNDKSVER
jgi:cytochrome b involved in lipid metabolism